MFLGLFGLVAGIVSAGAAALMGASVWLVLLTFFGVGTCAPMLYVLVLAAFSGVDALAPPKAPEDTPGDPGSEPASRR